MSDYKFGETHPDEEFLKNDYEMLEEERLAYYEYLEAKQGQKEEADEIRSEWESGHEAILRGEKPYEEQTVYDAFRQQIEEIERQCDSTLDFHYLYGRQRYPLPDEVGIIHPDNKSAILLRDTKTIDIFTPPNMGIRLDAETESIQTMAPNTQVYGDNWAGVFREHFALETEENIYQKSESWYLKVRDKLKIKVNSLMAIMNLKDYVWSGAKWFLKLSRQMSIFVQGVFSVHTSDFRFNVPITKIGVQGHYLDQKVLYTEEIWKDILEIKSHLEGIKVAFDSHTHIAPIGGPTTTPSPFHPTVPELGDYDDPVTGPWPYEEDRMDDEVEKELEKFLDDSWEYMSETEWMDHEK